MNKQSGVPASQVAAGTNTFLWALSLAFAVVAVTGNVYFQDQPLLYRSLGIAALGSLALLAWLNTSMGIRFRALYRGARIEMRKVVWPTSQETFQSTLVVVVVVAVISLLLWLFDSVFAWVISLLIGA